MSRVCRAAPPDKERFASSDGPGPVAESTGRPDTGRRFLARRVRCSAKNAVAPRSRSFFTYRFMPIGLMPNARTASACVQDPFTTD